MVIRLLDLSQVSMSSYSHFNYEMFMKLLTETFKERSDLDASIFSEFCKILIVNERIPSKMSEFLKKIIETFK